MLKANLEKILEEYIWFDPIEHVDVNDEENEKRTKELIDKATSQILALLESVVPEEKKEHAGHYKDVWCHECGESLTDSIDADSFNACIAEIKERLK